MRLPLRFLLITSIVLPALVAAQALAENLKIAIADHYPPFVIQNGDGSRTGFNIDMANALCAAMQAECELLPVPPDALLNALTQNTADAVIALPATELAETDKTLPMSTRYYKLGARFTRSKETSGRIAYKRMAGKKVAVVSGTIYDTFLTEKFPGVLISRMESLDAAYAALNAGEVEYVLADRAEQLLRATDNENINLTGPNYSTAKYFADVVIVARDDALATRFSDAIKNTRANGTYQEINSRYFPFDIHGR